MSKLIKRKDGSYSRRGLWDNIRANKGSGRKPTEQMLIQERKIKKMQNGGSAPKVDTKSWFETILENANPFNWFSSESETPTYQQAFAKARMQGLDKFNWNGKEYTTELAKEKEKSTPVKPKEEPKKQGIKDITIAKILAGYNWGPGNMRTFLEQQKASGVDIHNSFNWVNNLPSETKSYINRILFNTDPVFQKQLERDTVNSPYNKYYGYGPGALKRDNVIPNEIGLRLSVAESHHRPDVVTGQTRSKVGAQGLTQIMPLTLQDFKQKNPGVEVDLNDPKDNVMVSDWMLNWLSQRPYLNKSETISGANPKKQNGGKLTKLQGEGNPSQVMKYDQDTDTYESRYSLPEITVTGKAPRDSFGRKMTPEQLAFNQRIHNAQGQALGNIMRFTASGPQQAMMYGLTGKAQYPSEAMGVENPYGAFAVDMVTDPSLALTIGPSLVRAGAKGLAKSAESGLLSKTWKLNPWAFKPNEANWYRQVGKSAIDDAFETGLIREAGEEVSPKMLQQFEDQLIRMQGSGPEAMLSSRRPASPFFGKGELFFPMGRKPIITKSGKISKRPAGKGSADYLIETSLPNESFQPAYVKGMGLGVPSEVGSTAILKPDPSLRNLENFKIYKQDWLRGYKQIKKQGGVIVDPRGQWAHPGEVTRIPGNNITMAGVNRPLLGIPDKGRAIVMKPGKNYKFTGAKHVTEYPL